MNYEKTALAYAFDALEPHIDAATMQVHYEKHHTAYTDKLNAFKKELEIVDMPIEELLAHISSYPAGVVNNAGGYYNHNLFWSVLTPGGSDMSAEFQSVIESQFDSVENCMAEINEAAKNQFGSGWAWLCVSPRGELKVIATANQDNPLMDFVQESEGEFVPILGIDVWEHAYYLHYQNRRPDYLDAIWNVVNWEEVERRYRDATGSDEGEGMDVDSTDEE